MRESPCGTLINGQMARPLSQLSLCLPVCVCELQGSSVDLPECTDSTKGAICQPETRMHTDTHVHMLTSGRKERKGRKKKEQKLMCIHTVQQLH